MRYIGLTDKGLIRDNNEDSHSIFQVGNDTVFVIADGMGGHAAGELASITAVNYINTYLQKRLKLAQTKEELENLIHSAVEQSNIMVYLESLSDPKYKGMGTTLTVGVLRDWRFYLSHIGDCRAYLLHGSALSRLTIDHTLVQELLNRGSITAQEAVTHPNRHLLIKSLGVNDYVAPDTRSFDIYEGDLILMCTDGLYGAIDDSTIRSILSYHKNLDVCSNQLIEAAKEACGKDNITVILVHCKREKNVRNIRRFYE